MGKIASIWPQYSIIRPNNWYRIFKRISGIQYYRQVPGIRRIHYPAQA